MIGSLSVEEPYHREARGRLETSSSDGAHGGERVEGGRTATADSPLLVYRLVSGACAFDHDLAGFH